MLLHRNQHFKAYVISRTNIDQIVRNIFFDIFIFNIMDMSL